MSIVFFFVGYESERKKLKKSLFSLIFILSRLLFHHRRDVLFTNLFVHILPSSLADICSRSHPPKHTVTNSVSHASNSLAPLVWTNLLTLSLCLGSSS